MFFLPVAGGQRLAVYHAPCPGVAPRAALVYVHPFAEEMNKSRRMASLQARAFAAAGCAVMQVDLFGCGDSSGDFGDASWRAWTDDVIAASQALAARCRAPLWLWGLRAGALLASAAAARMAQPDLQPAGLLLWQPAVSGKLVLQQFLRLKSAGDMLANGARGGVEALRAELAGGRSVEVAGYCVGPALAEGLEAAALQAPPPGTRVEWLEVAARPEARLLPTSTNLIDRWAERGIAVRSGLVGGPAFWQTTEIEDAPALIEASLAAVLGPGGSGIALMAEPADRSPGT